MSGIIFLKKSNFSLSLIHDWERVLKKDSLIDDSKSFSRIMKNLLNTGTIKVYFL